MPREASGLVRLQVALQERNTAIGAGGDNASINYDELLELVLASGISDGQIDRIHRQALSLTTTPTNVDLRGVLQSLLGAGANDFVDLALVLVVNTGVAGNIVLGGNVNAVPLYGAAAQSEIIPPGGFSLKWLGPAGVGVTAGTGDILQLAASAGVVPGRLLLAGRSA